MGTSALAMRADDRCAFTAPPSVDPLSLREALVEAPDRFPLVRVVRDYALLQKIGRLRHLQYVANQGKAYRTMVLDRHCLIEPEDFSAVNIYARDGHGITCALRVAESPHEGHPFEPLYDAAIERLSVSRQMTLTCTRLVRVPRHSGRHVVDLIRFVRWQTVRGGWRYCLMQTADRLLPFFRKFEFVETGLWSEDPVAGRLHVLFLDTKMQPIQRRNGHDE